jgi:hypothetical protein
MKALNVHVRIAGDTGLYRYNHPRPPSVEPASRAVLSDKQVVPPPHPCCPAVVDLTLNVALGNRRR